MWIDPAGLEPCVLRRLRSRPPIFDMIPAFELLVIAELPERDRIKADPILAEIDASAADRFSKGFARSRRSFDEDEGLVV